jgi:hypothetical protein
LIPVSSCNNSFAAQEDLDAEVEINSACETIRENNRISAKEGLNNVRCEVNTCFRNEKRENLKDKIISMRQTVITRRRVWRTRPVQTNKWI